MVKSLDYKTIQDITKDTCEADREYRKKAYEIFSSLPTPRWKRIDTDDINLPYYKNYMLAALKNSNVDGISVKDIKKSFEIINKDMLNAIESKNFGVDEKFVNMAKAFYNTGFYIKVDTGKEIGKPVIVDFAADDENDTVIDNNIIEAETGSSITVVFDYSSHTKGFHNGKTVVIAKERATVNIVKIQRFGDDFDNFDNNIVVAGRDATVNWTNVELGSKVNAFDVTAYLDEIGSSFNVRSAFLGIRDQKYDMSYRVYHTAQRTTSSVDLKGALKDSARAVFRGNIDIRKGAKKAKADESETVLLLDKTVKSDAIPALFCAEDDVQANHSASAGQIDESKLYYIMSRGLSLEEAKLLMVQANLNPVVDLIPYDPIKEIIIKDYIGRRILS